MKAFIFEHLIQDRILRPVEDGVDRRDWNGERWVPAESSTSRPTALVRRETMLLPDSMTLFRFREFPQDQVDRASLPEAIDLDVERWSPFAADTERFFVIGHRDNVWAVGIWVWSRAAEAEYRQSLGDVSPTHRLPLFAWKLLAAPAETGESVFVSDEMDRVIAWLAKDRVPEHLAFVSSVDEEARFRRLTQELPGSDRELTDDLAGASAESLETISLAQPDLTAMRRARYEGVTDWMEPVTWYRPVATLTALYIVWIVGTGLATEYRSSEVAAMMTDAQAAAADVVEARARVQTLHQNLSQVQLMRAEQVQFEQALVALSETLPEDAWVEALQYDEGEGGWLDISGNARESARLAASLEATPEFESANFLSAIRTDERTGVETFRLRLKLKSPAPDTGEARDDVL